MGGLGVTVAIARALPLVKIHASDAAPGLAALYEAVRAGWSPPDLVTRDTWQQIRDRMRGQDDKLAAFVGFGCSFNGVYFTAYGAPEFAKQAGLGLRRKLSELPPSRVTFARSHYHDLVIEGPCVVYCDPPYRGTDPSAYRSLRGTEFQSFDSDVFWSWVKSLTQRGAHVLVSEYEGPEWTRVVWQKAHRVSTGQHAGGSHESVERLFYASP